MMIRSTPNPRKRARVVACRIAAALALLVLAVVQATDVHAAPYPLAPYGDTTGTPICDVSTEINPSYSDIVCNTTDDASSYVGADSTTATFGFVLATDPRTSGNPGPLESTAYVVAIAKNGTQVATLGIDGKRVGGDDVVYMKCFGNAAFTHSYLVNDGIADGRVEIFGEPSSAPAYRLQFSLPYSYLSTCGIDHDTPIQLFFGTSQAANLDVINKDFFRGSGVDFTGLATINLAGTLSATKSAAHVSGPNPPAVGSTSVYDLSVTVQNGSPFAMNDVVVTDAIPDQLSIVSLTVPEGSASASGNAITWNGVALGLGETRTLVARVSVVPTSSQIGQPIVLNPGASVTATRADGTAVSDTSEAVSSQNVVGAAVGITKTVSPAAVNVGENVTYTITLTNTGNIPASVGTVSDTLPAGVTYVAGSTAGTLGVSEPDVAGQTITWSGGSVPAGASRTVTFTATVDAPGTLLNAAAVAGSNFSQAVTGPTAELDANGPPIASDDSAAAPQDASVSIEVLGNDLSPDGDAIAVGSMTQPAHGVAVLEADRSVTYTPNTGYAGSDTFTYTACDARGACATATVTIDVFAPDGPPVVLDDDVITDEDTPIAVDVLDNDLDPVGEALTVTSVTAPAHGTATIDGGAITYAPAAGYSGNDSFTYEACTPSARCASATVSIVVLNVNHSPTAADDEADTSEDEAVTIDVLANDDDPDGDDLTPSIVEAPANGTVVVGSNGTITYTPTPGSSGSDSFEYQVCDTAGACATATVTVTVHAAEEPPVEEPPVEEPPVEEPPVEEPPVEEPPVEEPPVEEPLVVVEEASVDPPAEEPPAEEPPAVEPAVEEVVDEPQPPVTPVTPQEQEPVTPAEDAPKTPEVEQPHGGGPASPARGPRILPHTGANVVKLSALGVFLLAAGLAMQASLREDRRSRANPKR